jgi:hypothetical protein
MLAQGIDPNGKVRALRHGSSASAHEVVTPADSGAFTNGVCTGIYVGTGGNVAAVVDGVAVTYTNVPSGFILPVNASRVNSTNTTATSMVAMFG